MRAREFIYEDKKRIDEVPAIPVGKVISGVATAGFVGYQAYETFKDFEKYNNSAKTQADVDELVAAVGEDIAWIAAGAGIGYAASKTAQFVGKVIPIKKGMQGIRQIYRAKRAASMARKAQKAKERAQQLSTTPGSSPYNIRLAKKAAQRYQDKADDFAKKAGIQKVPPIKAPGYNVTGTTVTSKGIQQTSKGAQQTSKGAQQPVKKKPETKKPETKKPDDVSVPTAVTTAGATKFIPKPIKDKITDKLFGKPKPKKDKDKDKNKFPTKTTGAGAAKVAQKGKSKAGFRGAVAGGLAAKAIQKALDFDKDETAADRKKEFDRLKGQVVYTGFEKDPPVKRFDAGGLGTKFPIRGERPKTIDSKTMAKNNDSSSTVGSNTPKLPKQNKDPLSQQKAK
ncbi:MAG: hypothetical protein CMF52_01485 [Legionellales bacterium]|nr:hypothetical protein [Legionellales bacterium]